MTYICLKTKSKQVDFQSFNQFELQKEPHLWERVPSPNVLAWPVWWYTGDSGTQEAVAAPAWWLSRLKKKKKSADLSFNLGLTMRGWASHFHPSSGLHT